VINALTFCTHVALSVLEEAGGLNSMNA